VLESAARIKKKTRDASVSGTYLDQVFMVIAVCLLGRINPDTGRSSHETGAGMELHEERAGVPVG
jgi:hypothetical protein